MILKKRLLITFIILIACIACDRVTKNIAKQNLSPYETISFLHDTVRLQYAENTGAFLSFGANVSESVRFFTFTILVGIFLCGLLIYLLASKQLTGYQVPAMALVLGGGFGNLIDRIFQEGRVFDFLNVGIGSLRTGIFNIADMCITFGVLWFLFLSIRSHNQSENSKE